MTCGTPGGAHIRAAHALHSSGALLAHLTRPPDNFNSAATMAARPLAALLLASLALLGCALAEREGAAVKRGVIQVQARRGMTAAETRVRHGSTKPLHCTALPARACRPAPADVSTDSLR